MAEQLAEQLHVKVMQRGIHPGHCAVVFDGGASVELFPPQDGGLPAFVQLVNDNLKAIPAKSQAGHMLQMSPNIEETLLYSRNARSTAATPPKLPPNHRYHRTTVTTPLLSDTCADVEDTAAYQAERHAEVINLIVKKFLGERPYPQFLQLSEFSIF